MGDSIGSIAAANQVVRGESFEGGPRFEGTRGALIAAGVAPPGAAFPGDPGVRGPRFTGADGHIWKITRSPARGEFRVEWYLRPREAKRRHEARWEAHKAGQRRKHEIAGLKTLLQREPSSAAQVREKCLGDVKGAVDILSRAIEPMGADERDEIECLIGSILNAAHSATIFFDPSKRRGLQRRLAELQTAEARADRGFQDVLGKTLSGGSAIE
jgi:hypothetical protein